MSTRSPHRSLLLRGLLAAFVVPALMLASCGAQPESAERPAETAPAPAQTPEAQAPATQATQPKPVAAPAGATDENSCVECHRRKETVQAFPAWSQDQFIHWYGAVHGRVGVTCDACHGGNPDAWDKTVAHKGMLSSRNPESPIFYKNVPKTCGQCHSEVYASFEKSHHYEELLADHLAPSCNTCHGFQMDVGAVTPVQILERCTLCHNAKRGVDPEVVSTARKALDDIRAARAAVDKAEVTVEVASDQGVDMGEAEQLLVSARDQLKQTGAHWHSFRLQAFENEAVAIKSKAQRAHDLAMDALLQE